MTPPLEAPRALRMPMSRVFSATIMVKMARMPKPATAMIRNSSTLRMPFSTRWPPAAGPACLPRSAPMQSWANSLRRASTTCSASSIVLELDLDAGDAVSHGPQVLQDVERHEDVIGVVFAHLRFEVVGRRRSGRTRAPAYRRRPW